MDASPRDATQKMFAATQSGAMNVTGKPPATENMNCIYNVGAVKSRYMPVLIAASPMSSTTMTRQMHPPLKAIDFAENKELNKIVGDNSKAGRLKQPGVRRSEGTAYSRDFQGHTGRRLEEAARPLVGPGNSSSLATLVAPGVASVTMTTSLDHHGAPYRATYQAGGPQMWRPLTQSMTQTQSQSLPAIHQPSHADQDRPRSGRPPRALRGWRSEAPPHRSASGLELQALPGLELGHHVRDARAMPGLRWPGPRHGNLER